MELKNNRQIRGLWLGIALAALFFSGASFLRADTSTVPIQGLTFDLPFDGTLKSTFGAQPDVASQKGTPIFVPGKDGQAFREGSKDSYLLYHADGNVRGDAGTVSVWIRPQWKKDDPHFHVFWHLHADGRFILYSPDGKKLLFLY